MASYFSVRTSTFFAKSNGISVITGPEETPQPGHTTIKSCSDALSPKTIRRTFSYMVETPAERIILCVQWWITFTAENSCLTLQLSGCSLWYRCTLLVCCVQRKISLSKLPIQSFVPLHCPLIFSRFLASRLCLSWAPVALPRCWWAKRRLVSEGKRNWCLTSSLELFCKSLPSLGGCSAKRCAGTVPLSVDGVSPAKNLPRVINRKLQRERGTELEAKLFFVSRHSYARPGVWMLPSKM